MWYNYIKQMKNFLQIVTGTLAVVFLVLVVTYFSSNNNALGSAPTGLSATIATSTNPTVGTTALTVFATSSCAARIITTVASPIMITFSDAFTPTATYGHLQAASTTVVYDSGQYGCGSVKVYSFVSSAISVSESR